MAEISGAAQAIFRAGHEVGDLARQLYDPANQGQLIEWKVLGIDGAFEKSLELIKQGRPIFEAGFSSGGAMAFADVMLPLNDHGSLSWRLVEVKSSTSVKDYQRDDIAIQAFVTRGSGVPLTSVAIAQIDSTWVYPGDENYHGLLTECDLTEEAFAREDEVVSWVRGAQDIASLEIEPAISTGRQCFSPYECAFLSYCLNKEEQAKYPVAWLPRVQSRQLRALIDEEGVTDMRDVPDDLLNERQRRVKEHTLSGELYFDKSGARSALSVYKLPAYFLDFETIYFAIPIWKGTRPYQQMPFQFSVHRLSENGELTHQPFLDLSRDDPSKNIVEALIGACGDAGPVFVYNASFEKSRMNELADRFPQYRSPLLAIIDRIVDLLTVAQEYYYHPDQCGSWSLKSVLPIIAPDLTYEALDVQDGGMAMERYLEAIQPKTSLDRKIAIHQQLEAYCGLDTFALVRLWEYFGGGSSLGIKNEKQPKNKMAD